MQKLIRNKMFLASTVVIGFALAFAGLSGYSAAAGLLALFALLKLLRVHESERNWQAIKGALDDYEEIIGGQLWRSSDADVLASDRVDDPTQSGPVRFEHICRTKHGAWFLLQVSVIHGRIVDRSLQPCDEATAKRRLQKHQDVYVRCFGLPTTA